MTRKVLLIGIDGATWRIMDPLIAKGKLPNLARLRAEGASGPLRSTVIPNTPPAWISFLTGKNSGKTGIYDFVGRQVGSYDMKVCTSRDNDEPTIFEILSEAGRRVCSVNMPMTYPPDTTINGVMISGIPLPPAAGDFCHPPELMQEIARETGEYRVDIDYSRYDAGREDTAGELDLYEQLLEDLYDTLATRQRVIQYLLERESPDLFAVVYSLVDRVQHYFWKFTDPEHPGYSEEGEKRFGEVIDRANEIIDSMIGELLEHAPDYDVIVASDHGFGPYYRDFHLNRWLMERGYLVLKRTPRTALRMTTLGNVLRKIGLGRAASVLPGVLEGCPVPRPYRKKVADRSDIIWSKTRAYANVSGISFNLKGREPEGIVTYGDEYRQLAHRIIDDLMELTDDRTGEKLIDVADIKENRFHGPRVYQAADVYFMIAGLSYHITSRLDVDHLFDDRKHFGMSGTHRMEGIIIIRGEGITANTTFEHASIMDVPATVLHLMGLPVLKNMDGNVLEEIFEESFLRNRPVRYIDRDSMRSDGHESGYTKEEEDEIKDILKGLGYLS